MVIRETPDETRTPDRRRKPLGKRIFIDVSSLLQLRTPLQDIRFAVDAHLGRLATYLRMLGFDALYEIGCDDQELSRIAARESRILLTRDRGLLKRGEITYGYFVRGHDENLLAAVPSRQNGIDFARLAFCLNGKGLMPPPWTQP